MKTQNFWFTGNWHSETYFHYHSEQNQMYQNSAWTRNSLKCLLWKHQHRVFPKQNMLPRPWQLLTDIGMILLSFTAARHGKAALKPKRIISVSVSNCQNLRGLRWGAMGGPSSRAVCSPMTPRLSSSSLDELAGNWTDLQQTLACDLSEVCQTWFISTKQFGFDKSAFSSETLFLWKISKQL